MSTNKTLAELEQNLSGEARNTLMSLFDEDSFTELSKFGGETAITGYGNIDGDLVYAFMQDVSVKSGAVCKAAAKKIAKLYAQAVKNGAPVIAIYDSKGGDISEGVELLAAYGEIISASASLSGVAPQIAVITGVCSGTSAAVACMADFVIMSENAELFVTSPFLADDKVEGAGSAKNAALSGVSALTVKDTAEAVKQARKLISLLPKNNLEIGGNDYFALPTAAADASLKGEEMLKTIADDDSLVELFAEFGQASYTGIGSVNWKTVGFVSTNKVPDRLTAADAAKIARFVTICDSYSIPVISVVDSDGFEASSTAELAGGIRDCAKLAQVYASATTPKIAVITGNALGGLFNAICSTADAVIALESAVIAPTTPTAAAVFLYADKCKSPAELDAAVSQYAAEESSALNAASFGIVDRVVNAEDIWGAVNSALDALSGKRVISPARKHINFVY